MTGYVCPDCDFKVWMPVAELKRVDLGLYDDARFPGRCILVWKRHVEHLTELDEAEVCDFFLQGRRAARAIAVATAARRVNYAVLGNTEAHLHLHLIPRFDEEPQPSRPPWEDPRRKTPLDPEVIGVLMANLRRHLQTVTSDSA